MAQQWTCRFCNETFRALRGFSMHLNSHNHTEHSNEEFRKQYFHAEHEKALTAQNIPHMEDQSTVIDDQEVAMVQEKEKNEAVQMNKNRKRKRRDIVKDNRMKWKKAHTEIHNHIQAV